MKSATLRGLGIAIAAALFLHLGFLGVASINFKPGDERLAIIDTPLLG